MSDPQQTFNNSENFLQILGGLLFIFMFFYQRFKGRQLFPQKPKEHTKEAEGKLAKKTVMRVSM